MRRWKSLSRPAPALSALASGVDGGGRVFFDQIAKSHDGSQCLGSSPINAGLRPLTAGLAEQRRPSYPPSAGGEHRGAHSGDSKNAAELSGLQAQVDLHLLHALIENAHAAAVPSHPHLPADILRRRFVKGSPHLHKSCPGLRCAGPPGSRERARVAAAADGGRSSSKRAATCLQVVCRECACRQRSLPIDGERGSPRPRT